MALSNFYQPNAGYGAEQKWRSTPFVQDFLDPEIPQGVYTAYLNQHGFGGQDRKSQWARQQYGQTQSGYQAALRENPALTYRNYLGRQFANGGLENMWRGLAPSQRGENPGAWGGRTNVIAWG